MKVYNPFWILDFIPFGSKNAISMRDLSVRINRTQREARRAVYIARCKGAVICSTCENERNTGYFRPESPEEALPYIRMQRSRIRSAELALQSVQRYVDDDEKKKYG